MDDAQNSRLTDPDLIKARDEMCAEIRAFFESWTWPNGSKVHQVDALFPGDPSETLALKLRIAELEARLFEVEKKLTLRPQAG